MKPACIRIFLVGTLLLASPGFAQDPVAALTLGAVLHGLMGDVEQVIQQAEASANTVLLHAGSEAYLTLQDAQVAYDKEMNRTMDRVDETTFKTIAQARSMVQELQAGTSQTVAKALTQAQTIMNTLPGGDKIPQVADFSPAFVASGSKDYPVDIEIKGNFIHSLRKGYAPRLTLGPKDVPVTQNTTQEFKFTVMASEIAPVEDKFGHANVVLVVPYREGFIFHHRREGTFKFFLGTLPSSPGKIVLQVRTKVTKQERQSLWAPSEPSPNDSFKQHSDDDDIAQDYCTPAPPEGWTIDGQTVRVVYTGPKNNGPEGDSPHDWSIHQTRTNPTACYHLETKHHGSGTSGKVDFRIRYDIVRDVETTQLTHEEPVELKWGDSKVVQYPMSECTFVFDSFLGNHQEYPTPVMDRFLHIQPGKGNVVIAAVDPKDVTLP